MKASGLINWPKPLLVFVNGIFWGFVGSRILTKGIKARIEYASVLDTNFFKFTLPMILVFGFFAFIFSRMVLKNRRRIKAMEAKRPPFWQMMPVRTWIILAFMMTLGIVLSKLGAADGWFGAVFYPGLGSALSLAGLSYIVIAILRLV